MARGAEFLITVDNGISSIAGVAAHTDASALEGWVDGDGLLFTANDDGYSNLFAYSRKTNKVRQLTRFTEDITSARLLDTGVFDDDLRPVQPGSGVVGRVANAGRLPLGYLNDPEKTAATFIEVDGQRYCFTGDLATVEDDGTIQLLGRGSQCINTGGEKVFPEEVESALVDHEAVRDVLVVGVPDERWGSAVAAVVSPADPDAPPTLEDVREHLRGLLAGYKLPKHLVVVPQVERSPAGKADYRWAKAAAEAAIAPTS